MATPDEIFAKATDAVTEMNTLITDRNLFDDPSKKAEFAKLSENNNKEKDPADLLINLRKMAGMVIDEINGDATLNKDQRTELLKTFNEKMSEAQKGLSKAAADIEDTNLQAIIDSTSTISVKGEDKSKFFKEQHQIITSHGNRLIVGPGQLEMQYHNADFKTDSKYADSLGQFVAANAKAMVTGQALKNSVLDFVAHQFNIGTEQAHKDFATIARHKFGDNPITIPDLQDSKKMNPDFSPRGSGLIGGAFAWLKAQRTKDLAMEMHKQGCNIDWDKAAWRPSPEKMKELDVERKENMAKQAAAKQETAGLDKPAVEVGKNRGLDQTPDQDQSRTAQVAPGQGSSS